MQRIIIYLSICSLWFAVLPTTVQAGGNINLATKWYLKGASYLKARRYRQAVRALKKAYRLLPRHPHFNCHRTSFLNYQANAYERMRKPYAAMKAYYKAAYRSGCKKSKSTRYPARRYRALYRRWMCSIHFITTPPRARVFRILGGRDVEVGKTPLKKVFSPGNYKFKIRLYDHKTQLYSIRLRPGTHKRLHFKLAKGDDPISRPENVDVAPPPMITGKKTTNNIPVPKRKEPKKISFGKNDYNSSSVGLNGGGNGFKEEDPLLKKRKTKPSAPVYKQTWFWVTIGAVAVGTTVIVLVIPKESQVNMSQGQLGF